jgi:hypothetical protein
MDPVKTLVRPIKVPETIKPPPVSLETLKSTPKPPPPPKNSSKPKASQSAQADSEVDEIIEGVAVAALTVAAAAAAGYGIYRLGKFLFSDDSSSSSATAPPPTPRPARQAPPPVVAPDKKPVDFSADQWVSLDLDDLLLLEVCFESEDVDPWDIYQADKGAFETSLRRALEESLGSGLEVLFLVDKGSLWTNIVVRVKKGWNSARVNVSRVARSVRSVVTSNKTRVRAKGAFGVIKVVGSLFLSIHQIVAFFTTGDFTAIIQLLRRWFPGLGGGDLGMGYA